MGFSLANIEASRVEDVAVPSEGSVSPAEPYIKYVLSNAGSPPLSATTVDLPLIAEDNWYKPFYFTGRYENDPSDEDSPPGSVSCDKADSIEVANTSIFFFVVPADVLITMWNEGGGEWFVKGG